MAETKFTSYRDALHAANSALRQAHELLPVAQLEGLTAHELATLKDLTADLRNDYIFKHHKSGYNPAQISYAVGLSTSQISRIINSLSK